MRIFLSLIWGVFLASTFVSIVVMGMDYWDAGKHFKAIINPIYLGVGQVTMDYFSLKLILSKSPLPWDWE